MSFDYIKRLREKIENDPASPQIILTVRGTGYRLDRSIVLSLVLSVVLFISTSAFVTDLKQVSAGATEVTTYDIGFGIRDMDDSEMLQLYGKLKTVNGVYESSYQFVFTDCGLLINYLCPIVLCNRAFLLSRHSNRMGYVPIWTIILLVVFNHR